MPRAETSRYDMNVILQLLALVDALSARVGELEGARLMALLEVDACRRSLLSVRHALLLAG